MVAVLGISAFYHDSAAALIVDGELVCAMQEERFSRLKNDHRLPVHAIANCLKYAGIKAADLGHIVFYENPYSKFDRIITGLAQHPLKTLRSAPRILASQLGKKIWALDEIGRHLKVGRTKISHSSHHRSHAASAFFCSPFAEAAILTVDGVGEFESTTLSIGTRSGIKQLEAVIFPDSLGLFYAALTAFLGFPVNEGEYQVMGLAAFGTPRFEHEMNRILQIDSAGLFRLNPDYFNVHGESSLGYSKKLVALLGSGRRSSKVWDFTDPDDQRYADIAASVQKAFEDAVLGLARRIKELTKCDNLCLAGGGALNVVANACIEKEAGFTNLFVQPAAGDAGGALGAAILGSMETGGFISSGRFSANLGLPMDIASGVVLARDLGLRVTLCEDICEVSATKLAAGGTLCLAQDRFEWGPRALGQRSIIASAEQLAMKERLNNVIKKREAFRPFAPAVLADHFHDWFEGEPNQLTEFMTTVRGCKNPEGIPSAVNADHTGRVQSVSRESSPHFHRILQAFYSKSGVPVLINTSLNGKSEPICSDYIDVLNFYMRHGVDSLIMGDYLIQKNRGDHT